jgi:hypothetical protein
MYGSRRAVSGGSGREPGLESFQEFVGCEARLFDDVSERAFAQVFVVPGYGDAEVAFDIHAVAAALTDELESRPLKNHGHFAWPECGQSRHAALDCHLYRRDNDSVFLSVQLLAPALHDLKVQAGCFGDVLDGLLEGVAFGNAAGQGGDGCGESAVVRVRLKDRGVAIDLPAQWTFH